MFSEIFFSFHRKQLLQSWPFMWRQIRVVEHELLSLHKVMIKSELQMKEAMITEGEFSIFSSLHESIY